MHPLHDLWSSYAVMSIPFLTLTLKKENTTTIIVVLDRTRRGGDGRRLLTVCFQAKAG